jgi:transcriptional regulator with XRE-family HTH domain
MADDPVYQEFDPDKLWAIMRDRNISPRAIIGELRIEPRTLGKWLAGEAFPKPSFQFQLARVLGVTEAELLTDLPKT